MAAGATVLRDGTSMSAVRLDARPRRWGMIACRAGGTALASTTPVSQARDGCWHRFALTRDRDEVRLHLDGRRLTLGSGAPGNATSAAPWHVMRNGSTAAQHTRGRADEIAVYDCPLTAADVRQRVALGA